MYDVCHVQLKLLRTPTGKIQKQAGGWADAIIVLTSQQKSWQVLRQRAKNLNVASFTIVSADDATWPD